MNIFSDYLGHSDLHYSLVALFEKRLGGQLFTPDGSDLEWNKRGFVDLNPPVYVCENKLELINDVIQNPSCECNKCELIDGIRYYYKKMEAGKNYHCIQKAI